MKFPLSWLKEYLDTDASLADIASKLTAIGLEVDAIEDRAASLKGFVVGHVVSAEKHPDADKLQCLVVDTGSEQLKVVCGAPNARKGMKGVFAPAGSYIPGLDVTLKKTAIRGQESNGMMCSARELCLSDEHAGIIELADSAVTGSAAADALGVNDPIIDINLTPNRGDCAGVYGVARDLAAAGLGRLMPLSGVAVTGNDAAPITVTIDDAQACPLFIARYIAGVKNAASPDAVAQKLTAAGQRPIDALVDITNEMSLGYNRPLHVFDADKIKGNLKIRLSKAGESFAALNEKTYTLDDGMIVICDDSGIISLAGIMGGASTAVDANTKNVLVECALFDPVRIAKTGQKLQIDSEARYRFERGVDAAMMHQATDLATALITARCGGTPGKTITAGAVPPAHAPITYSPKRLKLLGGLDLPAAQQKDVLVALGFEVKETNADSWQVRAPSWRHDVAGSADIVEEVLRIVGYDQLPAVLLRPAADDKRMPVAPVTLRGIRTRQCLANRGIHETITWSFLAEDRADMFGVHLHQNKAALTLTNPISADLAVMRPSILPNLVDAAARNTDRGLADSALFEIGNIYRSADAKGQVLTATILRSGNARPRHWAESARSVDVYDAKADVLAVLEACGINLAGVQITTDAPEWYHPGRSGQIKQGQTVLASFGELHPALLAKLKREEAMAGAEIFLANMPAPKKKGPQKDLLKPSPFQPVSRDFAFIADAALDADKLVRAIKAADKALITAVDIFDVYQGKGVEPGKKSLGLAVTLQPVDKTLTDAEIVAISDKIIAAAKQTGAVLRG